MLKRLEEKIVKIGDLVRVKVLGKPRLGIVHMPDPTIPKGGRDYNDNDYYWVILTDTGSRKWIKGIDMELVCESD